MKWLNSMLADGVDGSVSSKRVITFLAFILCATAFVSELFWGYKLTPAIFDSMMYIVVAGLGVTASEKFAKKE